MHDETHERLGMSDHSVVRQVGTHRRPEEVEAKVMGEDVHFNTHVFVVVSA